MELDSNGIPNGTKKSTELEKIGKSTEYIIMEYGQHRFLLENYYKNHNNWIRSTAENNIFRRDFI